MNSDMPLDILREDRAPDANNDQEGLRRRFGRSRTESLREYTLPEADRGKDAWLFLAGCFLVEALIWGMTGPQGTLMLALVNMGVVFGAMSAGALNDRMHVSSVMALCSIGAAGAVFLFWGLSVSLPMLCIFSLLYGLTAGGFSANYTGIVQRVRDSNAAADSGMIFGFLAAGRGIGAVASGPLSEALLHMQSWKGEAKLGYGTGYGLLIVFTGTTAAAGGASWVLRRIGFK
ncbi:MAG: hypothetical protein Q9208_003712 [Pyrenodesmia sp. 3 TL-2023]